MQNAKRMVLIDERLLEHLQNKQDKSWMQPTEETVKTSISKKLKTTLDEPSVPDDVKAKRYSHNLNRFMQTRSKLTDEPLIDLGPTLDELLEGPPPPPPPAKPEASPKKKKTIKLEKERTSYRKKKKPQRYADIDWERW